MGVARQYNGTAGRVENAQVTTWAVWSTKRGYALVDYEVFLPGEWFAEGAARLGDAGAPGPVAKRTKDKKAAAMTRRFLAGPAGPAAVVATGDEVYGKSPHLRDELYAHRVHQQISVEPLTTHRDLSIVRIAGKFIRCFGARLRYVSDNRDSPYPRPLRSTR